MTYKPKRKPQRVLAQDLQVGDVFIESPQHSARVLRVATQAGERVLTCRYTWQPTTEVAWTLRLDPQIPVMKVNPWPTSEK